MGEKVSSKEQKVSGEKQWKQKEEPNGKPRLGSATGIFKLIHPTAAWEEGSISELGDRTIKMT